MSKPWGLARLHPTLLSEDLRTIPSPHPASGKQALRSTVVPINKCRQPLSPGIWKPGLTPDSGLCAEGWERG